MSPARPAFLTPHPRNVGNSFNSIDVQLICNETKALTLMYRLKGDMIRLRVPIACPPRRADGLWQHTCFEVFIKPNASSDYYEFNFSPSGEWAAYGFHSYRDGGPLNGKGLEPVISVKCATDGLELSAVVGLDWLPAIKPGQILRLGLSAVVEHSDGKLFYWALRHPAEKPDFHHPDSFALEFALPD
ncbi:MAG TPA: DOMON-like domain-containing protein [Candidatus Binatus sp.]|nr:DOMON-like domain-containing protein [Candidatus Binatus sp.]